MGYTSLHALRSKKMRVLRGMDDSRNHIAILAEKIERLQKASSELTTSISEVEATKGTIDNLIIDEGRWKGEKEGKFEDSYSEYKDSVKKFISKTEDAKEAMEDDIKRYESEKAAYTAGLNTQQGTLKSIEMKIESAKKE